MKRNLLIFLLFISSLASAQVINFGKTLPVGAYSFGAAASYNYDSPYNDGGMSYMAFAGFGASYAVDFNLKYIYLPGRDFFGADVQYLFKETRKSYFNVIAGLHYENDFAFDFTGSYTYSPEFWLNLTIGLDFDVIMADQFRVAAWIPLNAGVSVGNIIFIFVEYDLPANGKSWDVLSLGVNYIIR